MLPDNAYTGEAPQGAANERLAGQPFGVVAGGRQQSPGGVRADSVCIGKVRVGDGKSVLEMGEEALNFGVEVLDVAG